MKIIDLSTFPRRSHYEFFKSYAYPYMGITANVDVTNLYNTAKTIGGSPFLAFLWAAATAANSVPELRQRIVNDQIVEYDHCDTAHTVALPDGTFVNCQTDCRRSFTAFQTYGKQCQEEAKGRHGFVQPGDDETQLIFVSSTPWITFTQVIQPTPMPADSNVRIVFGKFFDQNGRKMLPVNIQANHALVDGLHVGEFFRKFQELADSDLTAQPLDPSMDYANYPTLAPLKEGTPSGKQACPAPKTPAPALEQKEEKEQQPDPTPKNGAWKNNILREDTLPDRADTLDKMKTKNVFGSRFRREQIKSVTFLDTIGEMSEEFWDVSSTANRLVMAWVKPNGALYDLYIGAEGGMRTTMNCAKLFAGYVNLERITFGDALHTEGVIDMCSMFFGCESLTELDLSGLDTSGVRDMRSMFSGCKSLTNLDLGGLDATGVKDMSEMFKMCTSLAELDLSGFSTSEVQDMRSMFAGCASLTELDLSSFGTSEVQDMRSMFAGCASLVRLDLSSFDTSRVQNMNSMFDGCTSLTALNLSRLNTSAVQDMYGMFSECTSLTELDLSSFDISGVGDMGCMFYNCESLKKLDLSSFDTSGGQRMHAMFHRCPAGSKWQHLLR